jgi:hypothetical protein
VYSGIHEDSVTAYLSPEWIHLVPAREAERGAAQEEVRHVRAELDREAMQPVRTEAQLPQPIETEQHRGGVARATAEPAADGNPLVDADLDALADPAVAPQQLCGARREVGLVARHERVVTHHAHAAPRGHQHDLVGQVDRLEERAQLVVAVLPHPEHLEPEIHFRERPDANGLQAIGSSRALLRVRDHGQGCCLLL